MMQRRSSALALTAALLLSPATAAAFDRVVVLSTPGSTLAVRLQAELEALGLDTIAEAPPADVSPSALEAIAHDKEALATIYLAGGEHVLEIWIADRSTGKTVIREIPARPGGASDDTAVTKTVELLRASLLEVQFQSGSEKLPPALEKLVAPPVAPPIAEPPPLAPLPKLPERLVTIRLGPAIAFGAGGLPPSAQVNAEVVGALSDLVALGGELSIPTVPTSFEEPEGSFSRSQFWGTAVLELHPAGKQALVDPRAGVSLGLQIANGEGDGRGANLSGGAVTVAVVGLAEAGIAVPLSEVVALDAEIDCGVAMPRTDYLIGDRVIGSAGWPSCSASLGVALSL